MQQNTNSNRAMESGTHSKNETNPNTKLFAVFILIANVCIFFSCGQKSAEEYFSMGKDSLNVGNYISAIKSFKKVVEMNPQQETAYYYLGLAYSKSEINTEDAINAFNKAVSINSNYLEAYEKLIEIYGNAHKLPEVIKILTNAINANPTWEHGYLVLGAMQYSSGNYHEALNAFKSAYSINPKESELKDVMENTYSRIIDSYKRSQDWDSCIQYAQDAIKHGLYEFRTHEDIYKQYKALKEYPQYYNRLLN